jgi:hypothetical protein
MGLFFSLVSTALRWEVFSFLLSICLAFAFGMQSARHYKAAKRWFWAGALLAWTKIVPWAGATSMGFSQRITISAVLCVTVLVLLTQTIKWVERIEKQELQQPTSFAESGVGSRNGSQLGDVDALANPDPVQPTTDDDNGGAEYCYLMPMTVHDYRPANEERPIAIMNPFDQPVYDVVMTIGFAKTALDGGRKPSGSSEDGFSRLTLKPGTVFPGLHVTGIKLQPGTYSTEISTRRGTFSEALVIVWQNGKLIFDFTLTRPSNAEVLIGGASLLKQKE